MANSDGESREDASGLPDEPMRPPLQREHGGVIVSGIADQAALIVERKPLTAEPSCAERRVSSDAEARTRAEAAPV